MRRRYAALLLCVGLGLAVLNGCGGAEKRMRIKSAVSQEQEDRDEIFGEVSQITEDTVIIKIGSRKEREYPESGSGHPEGKMLEHPEGEMPELPESGKMPDGQQGEIPPMLELTGEEQEIKVSDNTVIKRENRGRASGGEEAEEITIMEIAEGDTVRAVFAEDGSTEEIIVISPLTPGVTDENAADSMFQAQKPPQFV